MNKYQEPGPQTEFENEIIAKMSQQDLYAEAPEDITEDAIEQISHDEEKIDPFAIEDLPTDEIQTETVAEYQAKSMSYKPMPSPDMDPFVEEELDEIAKENSPAEMEAERFVDDDFEGQENLSIRQQQMMTGNRSDTVESD